MTTQVPEQPVTRVRVREAPAPRPRIRGRSAAALGVIAGCNAMIQLDDPIVNIALPGMREGLGLSAVGASWVINAYLLAFGGLLLLGGRAGDLLGRRRVLLAYAGTLAVPGALIGTYFFLNQFFQRQHGWSALATACALLPLPVTMAATAVAAGRLERYTGARRMWIAGASMLAAGNLWLAALSAGDSYVTSVLPALPLLGAGMACSVLPATVLATSGLRADEAGGAAGVLNALQSVGGSVGLAALVTVSSQTGGMTGGFAGSAAFACLVLLAATLVRGRGRGTR
ncbi:MFS transporter [Streptomyces albogriseolus]|uniref:MFS transporter n=1 Tax=Streptomyces albogriseolus TaxID=1887 RepID=UPI003D746295